MTKKRTRLKTSPQLVPAAAALTVAGVLIGGAGTVIQLGAPEPASGVDALSFDAANYPPADANPERAVAADRVGRSDTRTTAKAGATSATPPLVTKAPAKGTAKVVSQGSCEASFYDEPQATASGEPFDPTQLTAASKTLPFNTKVRVTNEANGESVVVRINDRGPYVNGRCLDLSKAAFGTIATLGAGVVDVHYEVLAQDAT